MSILSKQEIKEAKKNMELADKCRKNLSAIVLAKKQKEQEINRIYQALKEAAAKEILASMDVEQINMDREGIRINTLRNAGIDTVGKVLARDKQSIQAIEGIGAVSAEKILANANAIKVQTMQSAEVSFTPENKNAQTIELVKQLNGILREQTVFKRADALYNTYYDNVSASLLKAEPVKHGFQWVFMAKDKKEEASAGARVLQENVNGEFGTEVPALYKEHTEQSRKGVHDSWKDFCEKNAEYYALLENIVDSYEIQKRSGKKLAESDVEMIQAAKKVTGSTSLPAELIQSIDAYPLDLSLLKANLRRYQTFGTKYILHQKKVLLGDEMGLGKTMQAIAGFCDLSAKGGTHFLVVCPLSVVVNWKREIESQSELKAIEVYGEGRAMEMTQWVSDGGVAITTYETLVKIPVPPTVTVDMMVVDEAHYIKNPEAQRTQAVVAAGQRAERILYMSGTPLENKVEEMQFLIRCLQPEIAEQIEGMKQLTQAEEFRSAIAPVYLRRVKEDVLKELPELIEKEQWGLMTHEEMTAYENALMSDNFMAVRQVSWQISDMSKSTKAQRLMEIWEEAKEGGRKLIIFSFFKDVLYKVSGLLGDYCVGVIDGSISSEERQKMIDELKTAKDGSALVAQIQAGGVGLNIQAASVVVFCEPQIKPSLETQAVARAYRMGQSRSVLVHRLLIQDSVDERVMEILHTKGELFEQFADESVIGRMDIQANEGNERTGEEGVSEKKLMTNIMEQEKKRLGIAGK
ncbi:MAG: DEAD/DEAH box helicase [Clostridiales bacterium]|nr:DEAD/DEAH box helicase [Clostridiales bacterium]